MFQVGQLAVYPAHGVGVIESVKERDVSENQQDFYIMRLLDSDMIIMIPTGNARNIGLRDIIDHQAVSEVYEILRHRPTRLNNQTWNRRYRDYMDKIKTGSPFRVAEVLRDLTLLKTEKDLSFGERKMLDTAKNLLVKFLNPEVFGGIQHLPLTEGEILLRFEEGQIPQDFRHPERRTGLDFIHVVPVPAIPGLVVDAEGTVTQDVIDFGDRLEIDNVSESDVPGITGGYHDDHVTVQKAHDVEFLLVSRH